MSVGTWLALKSLLADRKNNNSKKLYMSQIYPMRVQLMRQVGLNEKTTFQRSLHSSLIQILRRKALQKGRKPPEGYKRSMRVSLGIFRNFHFVIFMILEIFDLFIGLGGVPLAKIG